uniref:Chloroperoxidase n=1 Tax=Zeugodacus cucurbitae TaxID=28588 RepID=A0A0A1XQW3_ZEUCU
MTAAGTNWLPNSFTSIALLKIMRVFAKKMQQMLGKILANGRNNLFCNHFEYAHQHTNTTHTHTHTVYIDFSTLYVTAFALLWHTHVSQPASQPDACLPASATSSPTLCDVLTLTVTNLFIVFSYAQRTFIFKHLINLRLLDHSFNYKIIKFRISQQTNAFCNENQRYVAKLCKTEYENKNNCLPSI